MHEISKRVLFRALLKGGDEQGGNQPGSWDQPSDGDALGGG